MFLSLLRGGVLLFIIPIVFLQLSCHRPDEPNPHAWQRTGASARDILSAEKYTKLIVELQHMPGYRINDTTINNTLSFLRDLCDKPKGIEIRESEIMPEGRTDTLSTAQVILLEKKHRTYYSSAHTLTIYILVTNGVDVNGVLAGLAYYNTSIVIYGKTIEAAYRGNQLQSFVLQHELGHLMGLVNHGSQMVQPHEDSLRVSHCNNPNCTMNHASGSTQLDSNCFEDLKNRARQP